MVTVTVRNGKGEGIEVKAYATRSGLAVTASTDGDRPRGRYRITHLASGYGIGFFKNRPAALAALEQLLALPIDWTKDAAEITKPANAEKVREAIGQL